MILGPKVTLTRNRANTYFVELRFESEEGTVIYDHLYFNFDNLLKLLPILITSNRIELFDPHLIEFIHTHFCALGNTKFYKLVDIAYVDDSSVFHYFDFDLSYLRQHHPELLL